jgi:hypothetical protein
MTTYHAMMHFDTWTPGEHACHHQIEAGGSGEAAAQAERIADAIPPKERPKSVTIFDHRGNVISAFTVPG